jgi:regulator of sigma E protease
VSIIIFIIILTALVFVHEFGHFIVAKKGGIRVDEFGIGFPPKLFSWKRGETLYTVNLIPFGGFVKIFGETPDHESIDGPDKARSFVHKNRALQAAVLAAGIAFNLAFAWILVSASFMIGQLASAEDYSQYAGRVQDERVLVTSVAPGSPAEKAGLVGGDAITHIKGPISEFSGDDVTIEGVQKVIGESAGRDIAIQYERGKETKSTKIVPEKGIVEDKLAIGISMERVGLLKLPPLPALWEGAKLTVHLTQGTAEGLWNFIVSTFKGEAKLSSLSGPVGIVGMVGDATRLGFSYLLTFTAFISINLAVINLVPFPALDGGRLLFVLIESVIRKPINPKISNMVNAMGFVLLLTLMAIITYRDIAKLIG